MYLQEIIEVALGLIFVWLVLSIAIMQVQESIASIFSKRARDLKKAIQNMLEDEGTIERFYANPVIQSLCEPASKWHQRLLRWIFGEKYFPKLRKPSYIPANAFAIAVFDAISNAGTSHSSIKNAIINLKTEVAKLEKGDKEAINKNFAQIANLSRTIAGTELENLRESIRTALADEIIKVAEFAISKDLHQLKKAAGDLLAKVQNDDVDWEALSSMEPFIAQIRAGAINKGGMAIGKALNSLLAGVEDYATDADKALAIGRKQVETWFDNSMERMSGWYKRWAQFWAFVIALFVAISLNVDSVAIAKQLWLEPALRQATATYVDTWIQNQKPEELDRTDVSQVTDKLKSLQLPLGWDMEIQKMATIKAGQSSPPFCQEIRIENKKVVENVTVTTEVFVPSTPAFNNCISISNLPLTTSDLLLKMLGIFISAGAAMQGAPFWFDILKKLVNVRSSGVNPNEKTKETSGG